MRVLLTGNTGYLTQEWIEQAFPDSRVLITGNTVMESSPDKRITVLRGQRAVYKKIFEAYDIDAVVVFSQRLTLHTAQHEELETLEKLIELGRQHGPAKLLYLDGPKMADEQKESIISRAACQLCLREDGDMLQIRVVHVPYLYSGANAQDYFYRMFESLDKDGRFQFGEAAGQCAYFLADDDLAELVRRMMEDWPQSVQPLRVPDCFGLRFVDLENKLRQINPSWQFEYDADAQISETSEDDLVLRRMYGWFPRICVLEDLQAVGETYQQAKPKKRKVMEKLSRWRAEHRKLFMAIELLTAAVLTVLCGELSQWQVQFGLIDFRLLLVVLMGTMYGLNMGLLSATIASVLLVMAYHQQGTNWMTLFYEPTNWIAFIAYYIAGAVCGYLRLIANDKLRFAQEENEQLRERLRFAQTLYADVLSDKREYKKQIIGSQDSFGKIFDITQRLNVVDEQEVFIKAIEIIENIMGNRSVALYSVDRGEYIRLIASSKDLSASLPVSDKISTYIDALETVKNGDVYVNTKMLKGYPMYMAGLRHNGELVALAFVQEADYAQMSLYYINLFKILCGLISSSLAHALEHQEAIRHERCVEGTHILKPAYFEKCLELERQKDEQKIATHILLRIDGGSKSVQMLDAQLSTRVRKCDIVGYSNDGGLYLILAQATYQAVPIVAKRLKDIGVESELVRVEDVK